MEEQIKPMNLIESSSVENLDLIKSKGKKNPKGFGSRHAHIRLKKRHPITLYVLCSENLINGKSNWWWS